EAVASIVPESPSKTWTASYSLGDITRRPGWPMTPRTASDSAQLGRGRIRSRGEEPWRASLSLGRQEERELLPPCAAAIELLDGLPRGAPDALAHRRIVTQPEDEVDCLLGRVEEESVDAVHDVVGIATASPADYGQAARHRFEDDSAVRFQPSFARAVEE